MSTVVAREFVRTDLGNAELIAKLYGGELRFDHRKNRWLIFRDHWWVPDFDARGLRMAQRAARLRRSQCRQAMDEGVQKAELSWALKSESRPKLEAALELAKSLKPITDSGDQWDCNPWLFGVTNGVVDLRTGKLRNGLPSDRITQHTSVPFHPSASCPEFERCLDQMFDGDAALIGFVQRAIGYALTGTTSEQCLFALYGTGANGKSTLLETLKYTLGDYGYNLPSSALEPQGRGAIPNDIAALEGRRFVTVSEMNERAQFNEARIKALTGSDSITARKLYAEFTTFVPTAKFFLAVNHLPSVEDDSNGFWRRQHVIPLRKQFSPEEQDRSLLEKLKAEAPGILAWAVRGCLAYQAEGLCTPDAVRLATQEYRSDNDSIGEFLLERCAIRSGAIVSAADVWNAYKSWAHSNGERPLDRKAFSRRLEARGFRKGRAGHERQWRWEGLGLITTDLELIDELQ